MSFRFRVGAAVLLGALLVCSAQAAGRQRGRAIEFSEPRSDEVTTNLNQLTSKKDSLKLLEEDLYQPLQSFAPRSSLEGVVAPPPRAPAPSAIQNKRVKDLLERRKNWVFMTPEDLLAGPTVEQILKAPQYEADGQEKKQLPTLDRYYQRLTTKRPAKSNLTQPQDDMLFSSPRKPNSPEAAPARDDVGLPGGVRESEEALKTLSDSGDGSSPFSRGPTANTFSDPFRMASRAPSKERTLEHKKLMDEYRSIVDPNWHPPDTSRSLLPSFGPADAAQSEAKPVTGLPGAYSPAPPKAISAPLNAVSPVISPPGRAEVNVQNRGLSMPGRTLPDVREGRGTPPAPSFTPPRRAF